MPPSSPSPSPAAAPPAQDGQIPETPQGPVLAQPPGWRNPLRMPGQRHPDQPTQPGPEPPSDDAAAAAGSPGATGSPARSPLTPELFKGKAKTFAVIARTLLVAAGGLANSMLAIDEDDETWLPDDDDQRDIPEPLGRLAARRIPLTDKIENLSDVEDLAALAVGVATYAAKGLAGWMNGRREKRRLRNAGTVRAEGLQQANA
jgi:hypothetical protein